MKKLIYLISLITSFQAFSQNSFDINERKGKLFFSLGTEYRITPVYDQGGVQNPVISIATIVDVQNSGTAFNMNLNYFISKNLSFGFGNSIRYDLVSLPLNEISEDFGFRPAQNSLIFGYHFYFDYHFKIFKKSEIFIRIGKSFLNRGTDFRDKKSLFDSNGELTGSIFSLYDTAYEPINLGLGFKKNRISGVLGVYTSSISEYFDDSTRFTVPYFSFSYNLGKL